ncbi:hypothetical protein S7335_3339 [Synechococcus sp. PCC 7335]|nr:hypothetical protein S7335_3339 [Synechococcus sp. PCC 7335]
MLALHTRIKVLGFGGGCTTSPLGNILHEEITLDNSAKS